GPPLRRLLAAGGRRRASVPACARRRSSPARLPQGGDLCTTVSAYARRGREIWPSRGDRTQTQAFACAWSAAPHSAHTTLAGHPARTGSPPAMRSSLCARNPILVRHRCVGIATSPLRARVLRRKRLSSVDKLGGSPG